MDRGKDDCMSLRWMGAALIVLGCGGVGALMALRDKREYDGILQLIQALDFMACELSYRMTPLPELCHRTADRTQGSVSGVFSKLADELERQIAPDAACCMRAALAKCLDVPPKTEPFLAQLGLMLGQFDLQGQLQGLQGLKESCELARKGMELNRPQRLRSYQTLGLCAGAAIAILFI